MLIIIGLFTVVSAFVVHVSIKNYWIANVINTLIAMFLWWVFDSIFYGNPLDVDILLSTIPIGVVAFVLTAVIGLIVRRNKSKAD